MNFTVTHEIFDFFNCSLYIDGELNATNNSIPGGAYASPWMLDFTDGDHNWTVDCSNFYGTSDMPEEINFTVDTENPLVTINSPSSPP